jgi:hypothetical protein
MQHDDEPLDFTQEVKLAALRREFEEFRQEVRQRWQREDTEEIDIKREKTEEYRRNWQAQYPKWNATNLETEGITPCRTTLIASLVDKAHPIINLLQLNAAFIGCDISKQPLFKDQYHKISNQVIAACCNTIRTKVMDWPPVTKIMDWPTAGVESI